VGRELERLLEEHAAAVATRRVVIASGLIPQLPTLLREAFPGQKAFLLVADRNTWEAAGHGAADVLTAAGFSLDSLILEPRAGESKVHPGEDRVEQVASRLQATTHLALGVGAGTINDLVKAASSRVGRPCAVIATAPSMNGYTSGIAAIVIGGLKQTLPVRGAVLVVADTDVLCQAPAEMIGAGFADMMAKWVASADWRLAERLLGGGYDARVEQVSRVAIDLLEGREEAIALGRAAAIENLIEALCVSGLSMAVASSSAHISGAEHLFAHYIEMMMPKILDRELHGRQVGIGTLCSAALYEQLLGWSPERLDVEARVAAQLPWKTRRAQIERHFTTLAPVVTEQAQQLYVEGEELRVRLKRLAAEWPALRTEVAGAVAPRATIEDRLRKAGAPIHFAQLGITPSEMREILLWAADIRARYTVLHLAADLGCLGDWTDRAIAAFGERPAGGGSSA